MSNTVIQILRSYTANSPSTLNDGELAYSFTSNTLFIGAANNEVITIGGNKYVTTVDGGEF